LTEWSEWCLGVAVATHPHVSCTFGSIILKHGHHWAPMSRT
jgi:hypothetical protein